MPTDSSSLTRAGSFARSLASGKTPRVSSRSRDFKSEISNLKFEISEVHRLRTHPHACRPSELDPQLAVMELDLSPWRPARPAHARHGDHEQRLSPLAPRRRPQERHSPLVHLVHVRADVLPVPRRNRQRRAADVLLPSDRAVRVSGPPGFALARNAWVAA